MGKEAATVLAQLVQSWVTVLTQPSAAVFDRQRPAAALDRVLVGMLLAGLIAGIGAALGQLVLAFSLPLVVFDGEPAPDLTLLEQLAWALVNLILTPIVVLLGFFLWAGVLFLVAKALGGSGDFVVHSYLLSLTVAPITAINGVLSVIPCLAVLAALPLLIYQLVLTTFALQSAHGFSVGRAVAVWLIPLAALFFLGLCLVVAALILLVVAVGG